MKHIVKWGIIGLGNIAYHFAKSLHTHDNASLIAVASKSKEKLLRFKNTFNLKSENLHDDYNKLLDNDNLDIIYIALPNSFHFEWILKGIEKKKNILIEKPAFISAKNIDLIFKHKNFQKIFFSEGYMYKYHPQIIETIKILKSGELGSPIQMQTNCGMNLIYKKNFFGFTKKKFNIEKRIFNKKLGGGVILDLGCYTSSISLMIASLNKSINKFNFKIENIKTEYQEKDIDVHSEAIINFEDKFISKVATSFTKDIGNSSVIICENGKIEIENSWNPEIGKIKITGIKKRELKFNDLINVYSSEIEHISNDIMNNKKEATYPGTKKEDIFLNTKIIDNWINDF